jgi:hypothetical protein
MLGEVTFEVELTAAGGAGAGTSLTRKFAMRKPLRVAYLPIQVQGHTPPEQTGIDYWLLRLYPVSGVEYYRLPVPDMVWEGELSKAEILRRLLYIYWLYAQHNPADTWPDQVFGWLPPEAYNGGASDPFWCPDCAGPHSSRVAFGGLRPEQDIGGPRILVHEIAHNLGAQHAWSPTSNEDSYCFKAEGADIRVDPAWPYSQTPHIQEVGIDLYSQPPVIYSPSFYDMMAYCTLPWISPHTYRKIFDSPFLQPPEEMAQPLTSVKPQIEKNEQGTLLVSGLIYPDGTVANPEIIHLASSSFVDPASAFELPSSPSSSSSGEEYCVEARDQSGLPLARRCFQAGFTDLETGLPVEASPFVVPLTVDASYDAASITIRRSSAVLAVLTPSNVPPQVTVLAPDGGESLAGRQTIFWEAADADGDRLLYDVLYSPDRGQSWLPLAVRIDQPYYTFFTHQVPASHDGLIRVVATDGFYTASDESNSPFTVEIPLENSISLLGPAVVKPGQNFELTIQASRITEPGLFGVQFELEFDPARLYVENLRLNPNLNLVVNRGVDNTTGRVVVAASQQGPAPNLTGEVPLAVLTITAAQASGATELRLSNVAAGARGGVRLSIPQPQGLILRISP